MATFSIERASEGAEELMLRYFGRLIGACLFACPLAIPAPVVAQTLAARPDGIQATNGGIAVDVTALTDLILRVRIARDGRYPENASWAVPAAVRAQRVAVQPTADGFTTSAVAVHLDPATLR